VIHRSGVAPAVTHSFRVVAAMIHRRSVARSSLLGKRATDEVRMGVQAHIEERKTHEQEEDHGARKGEWQMVEKQATPLFAAGAQRLFRRSGVWLRTQTHA